MNHKTLKGDLLGLRDENLKRDAERTNEIYKGYKIEYFYFGYFSAENLNDCDAEILTAKSIEELKIQINELCD
jgi:hypothetical protein